MTRRSDVLELAVLGLLQDAPMHGYELRKRLVPLLGLGRTLSYGTLYPSLKELGRRGYLAEADTAADPAARTRRGRVVYSLTPEGKERFVALLGNTGPTSWEDDSFGVRFAFFSQVDATVRLRVLEGRRSRLEERLDAFREARARTRARLDAYTLELQQHGLESAEREVRWLDSLIDHERRGSGPQPPPPGSTH